MQAHVDRSRAEGLVRRDGSVKNARLMNLYGFNGLDRVEVHERSGLVEVTVGLLGSEGAMRAFHPSITVAEGAVLSELSRKTTSILQSLDIGTLDRDGDSDFDAGRIGRISEEIDDRGPILYSDVAGRSRDLILPDDDAA